MKRRDFVYAMAATSSNLPAQQARRKKGPPQVGMKHVSSDADLKVLAALGVKHILANMPSRRMDENWSVAGLSRFRERVESHGIEMDVIALPMSARPIEVAEHPNIMLGKSPERDREIDDICNMIRNIARAGISAAKYNLTILGVIRTEPTAGRGGAMYSSFDYEKAKKGLAFGNGPRPKPGEAEPPLTAAGAVSTEESWERITYFLKRVIPVAEEFKVRMACHPHDPAMPKGVAYRGVHRVLDTVEGLKRFVEIIPSPYHGLMFCQGTVSESLRNPGREIFDVIRYFASRDKIVAVDFRNIKGGFLNFQETFPDEGDVDMLQAVRAYAESGYDGMLMPDHVPAIEGDERRRQAYAHAIGYIQGLLRAVS